MKIKQLEWRGDMQSQEAKTPFGTYWASWAGCWMLNGAVAKWDYGSTLEATKLACQADFERRVRECVEEER